MNTGAVLLLDDDADIREAFSEIIEIAFGRECVGFASYTELIGARDTALGCAIAILDINLGPGEPSGIDAYTWLRDNQFAGPILFLTGHAAAHPLVQRASEMKDVHILAKPLRLAELQKIIAPQS
jgi:FixJ family two-component response regulator